MIIDKNLKSKRALYSYRDLFLLSKTKWPHYDFSQSVYSGMVKPMTVICKTHGVFKISPDNLKRGGGCKACHFDGVRKTHDVYLKQVKIISKNAIKPIESYNLTHNKILHECLVCTHTWKASPGNILRGKGCPKCNNRYTPTTPEFISELEDIFKGMGYDFSGVVYKNNHTKVKIICKKHGEFLAVPYSLKAGCGCSGCALRGFNKNKPATLYYLSVCGGEAFKVGVTNRSVRARYQNIDLANIDIIATWEFPVGEGAYSVEQRLLKDYKSHQYTGHKLLTSGNTELFNKDLFKELCAIIPNNIKGGI